MEDVMADVVTNLNERKFRFALTVESYYEPMVQKNDPKYVKYIFQIFGKRKGKYFQRVLPYHKCTDEDYKEFNPIKSYQTGLL